MKREFFTGGGDQFGQKACELWGSGPHFGLFCSSFLLSGSLGVSTLAEEDEEAVRAAQAAHLRQGEQMQTAVLGVPSRDELPRQVGQEFGLSFLVECD